MNQEELKEYSEWMWRDTWQQLKPAVWIYLICLGGFWLTDWIKSIIL